jgi:hypothetical protein
MSKPRDPGISHTLTRGFGVLQSFTASQPALSLSEIARRAEVDLELAFHLVQTLAMLGYVERITGSKKFRLTLKPLELGFYAIVQNPDAFPLQAQSDGLTARRKPCSVSELVANTGSQSERFRRK